MPSPAVILCIPGVAFIFLLQMLLCQAYHLHVSITKKRRVSPSGACEAVRDKENPTDEMGPNPDLDPDGKDEAGRNKRGRSETIDSTIPCVTNEKSRSRRKSVFAESYDPSKDDEEIEVVNPKSDEEKEWLIDNTRKVTLFRHLAMDQVITVVDAMKKHTVKKGDIIMNQGDKGSAFYVIQIGVYEVYVKDDTGFDELIKTYDNKGSFGELALLYNQPRAATIVAKTGGVLWTMDGQLFRRIISKITYQKRQMYENLIDNVPMLKYLEPSERANLVDVLTPMTYSNGDLIIKQGDKGDGMYFIISGGVKITMTTNGDKEVLMKEYGHGDYFGELALITNDPRAASVYAVGKTNVAFLDRDAFERLLGPCMDIMRRKIDSYNEKSAKVLHDASEEME